MVPSLPALGVSRPGLSSDSTRSLYLMGGDIFSPFFPHFRVSFFFFSLRVFDTLTLLYCQQFSLALNTLC